MQMVKRLFLMNLAGGILVAACTGSHETAPAGDAGVGAGGPLPVCTFTPDPVFFDPKDHCPENRCARDRVCCLVGCIADNTCAQFLQDDPGSQRYAACTRGGAVCVA